MQVILNHAQIQQKIIRLGHQILENCFEEQKIYIGGISGNGNVFAQRFATIIRENSDIEVIPFEVKVNTD